MPANRSPLEVDVSKETKRIVAGLRRLGDPQRSEEVQRYFKHEVRALGIDTTTVRNFAKERWRELQPRCDMASVLALCERLLQQPELEIRGVAILMLSENHKEFSLALLPKFEQWLRSHLDNWALVDSFCSLVLSRMLLADAAVLPTLRRWSGDSVLWVRRAALVTLVPFARKGQYLDEAYEFAGRQFDAPGDLLHKATGWLLREAGKTDPKRLRQFVLEHGPEMPRTALRYAIEKFPAAERNELLSRTKAPVGGRGS